MLQQLPLYLQIQKVRSLAFRADIKVATLKREEFGMFMFNENEESRTEKT
jgi:hypothetical protein